MEFAFIVVSFRTPEKKNMRYKEREREWSILSDELAKKNITWVIAMLKTV